MLLATDKSTAVIGLGLTGLSMARYYARRGRTFVAFDEHLSGAAKLAFEQEFPSVRLVQEPLHQQDFTAFSTIALSPGVPISTPSIAAAHQAGREFVNDVSLFIAENSLRETPAKIIAVTGSNGKSTVVTWLHSALESMGEKVALAGNIGISPLALLAQTPDIVILELSSFQLEIIDKLSADVACILNISPDHLDRYDSMLAYHAAKQRIYRRAKYCVSNKQDALTSPLLASDAASAVFSDTVPDLKEWGLTPVDDAWMLSFGPKRLLSSSALAVSGKHNALNALAVLALAKGVGIDPEALAPHLVNFTGLPHRCECVGRRADGVRFINDSKATNVGATVSAVNGLSATQSIVLLAGGIAKGADLQPLSRLVPALKQVVVFGESAPVLAMVFKHVEVTVVDNMPQAVQVAHQQAVAGDTVLLSPACASFDMFKNYIDRGEQFRAAVAAVLEAQT